MSSFADKLAAATGVRKPEAGSGKSHGGAARISGRVNHPRRAGRAPYNFVPLPESARWLEESEWRVDHSRYHDKRLSGEIEIELDALTDFYVRGLTEWQQYLKYPVAEERPPQHLPYLVNGKPAIPGSSLRGMVRTLVEILGNSPLEPVNDSLLYFRAVGSSSNPGERNSFEPHAVAYKSRVDMVRLPDNVKAGFLYGGREDDAWTIRPAVKGADGRQCYQTTEFRSWLKPSEVWFRPGRTPKDAEVSPAQRPGFEEGWLICSGPIPKKRRQWVIRKEDKAEAVVKIPERDVAAYKESGITKAIRDNGFEYTGRSKGVPCFYVEWRLPGSSDHHVTFGHTYNMRLPYEHSVQDGIPAECRADPAKWHLAQAIFGRTDDGKRLGARGRVSFGDALFQEGPAEHVSQRPVTVILGQPQPTTYQHYLVQQRDDVVNSVHWDGNYLGKMEGLAEPTVRGHKGYFHRPGAPVPDITDQEQLDDRSNVTTAFCPAKAGCKLVATIRYENLHPHEFGALLTALMLPDPCAHRLGMAKPLGLGSFRIRVKEVREIQRRNRYERVFDQDGGLHTAKQTLSIEALCEARNRFAEWILAREGATWETLWATGRMRELAAILTWDNLADDWINRTRYLEFGTTGDGLQYNEYKHVDYPRRTDRGRPFLEQRRPLPPASQVLTDSSLPSDPRPPFVVKARQGGRPRPGKRDRRRR